MKSVKAKKGQIFSLDYAISLILILFGLGLIINYFETKTLDAQENLLLLELENIGKSASNLIVSNPKIVCELIDFGGKKVDSLSNCIPNTPNRLTKTNLGLPNNYNCNMLVGEESATQGTIFLQDFTDCTQTLPFETKNVYSSTRKIVYKDSDNDGLADQTYFVTKKELQECINNTTNCPLKDSNITLIIWRNQT